MSAKARFLKKLQEQPSHRGSYDTKYAADIAEFQRRTVQLQDDMATWLTDTGVSIESIPVSVVELLAGGTAFNVQGIVLGYENRKVKFTPVFMYGQGVTGCVEVSLYVDGSVTPLYRLFMRSGEDVNWTWSSARSPTGRRGFCEDVFFDMIVDLLP
ncbi:hypothetical protein [Rahnella woolbedingensis]|uniref:Uncharacterized protein n=1 Tax=Rahnella woolbedingensis TaxID=1510574 RepID=A0A419N3B5_9GAMM|nr:hypothetical protein [Rahnella woolbedingensis]RJT37362.1 hypothetical protein D6C13_22100 [Rahnella woolbedingensis]